jgi:restriction endonuclease S subunit
MIRLGSIAEIRMGATLRGRDATRPVPDGRFQFVRIGDVSQDGQLLTGKFDRIEPSESVSEDLFLRSGDVLFPNRGTRTTALAYRLDQGNTLVGSQFFILRPDTNRVLPEYLAWFLRSEEAGKYFDGHRRGTYVKIIQRSVLTDLEMPLPPLEVQRRIVEMADLAVTERNLTERLAGLKWKLANDQLVLAARNSAADNSNKSPQ